MHRPPNSMKTKRPEPCAIQDSDRSGYLILVFVSFLGVTSQAVGPFRLSSSLKNRHRPGWRFLLFTTNPSVIAFRPTWKVNVKRMVLTSSRKWGQPPAVVCSACCRCSLKSISHFVTQCNKLLQPHHKGNTAQFPPDGLSTAPATAARHLRCQNAR